MKIVTVSTIRNEADIIESFVRYHIQFVDRMIITNHRSADASGRILQALREEGLPLDLWEENHLELQQGQILTRSMKFAVAEHGANWIVPLDADEFLTPAADGDVRGIFSGLPQEKIIKVAWRTHVPLPSDDPEEANVLRRIKHHKRMENQSLRKILIPRQVAEKPHGLIAPGSHGYTFRRLIREREHPSIANNQLVLAHYPVRSSPQILTKAFVGWLACISKRNRQPNENFHLKLLFDHVKSNRPLQPEELSSMALGYSTTSQLSAMEPDDLLKSPLALQSVPLRYTRGYECDPISVLAQLAEDFAKAVGAVKRMPIIGRLAA
jgi:hypothetical protein